MYLDLILEGNGERWQVNVSPPIWYCLLEKGDFIIFQTGDRLCHLDVEDCHKKKKFCITSAYLWPKQTKN